MHLARLARFHHQPDPRAACPAGPDGGGRRPAPAARESARARDPRRGPTGSGCWRRLRAPDPRPRTAHPSPAIKSRPRPSAGVGKRVDSVTAFSPGRSTWRSLASSLIGQDRPLRIVSRRQLSGSGLSRLRSDPSATPVPMTISSRMRVDGRVGDLGEELLEVVVERLRLLDSTASGVSLPIEPTGSTPSRRHRRQDHVQILEGVAESLLALQQRGPVCAGAPRPARADPPAQPCSIQPLAGRAAPRRSLA